MRPHRRQPTRLPRPWDSPGKNTGVGCHFLFQCMKVKSESEVTQSCPTLSDPMDCSPPGSSVHGIFQARVLEWGTIAFSNYIYIYIYVCIYVYINIMYIYINDFSRIREKVQLHITGGCELLYFGGNTYSKQVLKINICITFNPLMAVFGNIPCNN